MGPARRAACGARSRHCGRTRSWSKGRPTPRDRREAAREAHMRRAIRQAEADGFERIAIVCGAWHAPVLVDDAAGRDDAAALKGLPTLEVQATWIPWTYGRLTFASGYG